MKHGCTFPSTNMTKDKSKIQKYQIISLQEFLKSDECESPKSLETELDIKAICEKYHIQDLLPESLKYIKLPKRRRRKQVKVTSTKTRRQSSRFTVQEQPSAEIVLKSCHLCSRKFSLQSALQIHINSHKVYNCSKCSRMFGYEHKFRQHTETCLGQDLDKDEKQKWLKPQEKVDGKRYKCKICTKPFKRKMSMARHQVLYHSSDTSQMTHSCALCCKKFRSKYSLHTHKHLIHPKRKHKCQKCGLQFARSTSLKLHSKLHTGEKQYGCLICGAAFRKAQSLQVHTKLHDRK